ncbi:hypothetical protein M9H77_18886 [Catharanthus roseus]|uniref:Uncharacterized protein n=1 Tax=Catharanthus roseus TaxID=4058 RepID=A0ACC0B8S7_CATRO|nr:hypothetical protein M9H77_18886 [Catharanthus roseus]
MQGGIIDIAKAYEYLASARQKQAWARIVWNPVIPPKFLVHMWTYLHVLSTRSASGEHRVSFGVHLVPRPVRETEDEQGTTGLPSAFTYWYTTQETHDRTRLKCSCRKQMKRREE